MGLILCYGYVGLVLLGAYGIHGYGEEKSRKFVHIMTANWWLIAIVFFESMIGPLIVSFSFLIVNLLALKFKVFKQIELKDRDPGLGTIYYSISMIVLTVLSYFLNDLTIGLVGCLVMGYGDGLAALVGTRFPIRKYQIKGNHKSIGGSLTMFVVAMSVVLFAQLVAKAPINYWIAIGVGVVATYLEAISQKGRDNLWVPLGSVLIYCISIL